MVDLVDPSDLDALAAAIRPGATKIVWLETPANPTWAISDIAAAAGLAHQAGARLVVDGTAATPVLSRPLALGADLVMHSATKYLNGHGDVVAGALVTARADDFWARISALRHDAGAILGPFEAWLLLRGLRTLYLRVERASASAQFLAERLQREAHVAEVLYPGLADHPGHAIAARQMQGGFGGMLSLRVKGGEAAAIATAAHVKVWQRATSLGGVESLIEHRASIEGPARRCPPTCSASRSASSTPRTCSPISPRRSSAAAETRRRLGALSGTATRFVSGAGPSLSCHCRAGSAVIAGLDPATHGLLHVRLNDVLKSLSAPRHSKGRRTRWRAKRASPLRNGSCCWRARCWPRWRSRRPTRAACSAWSRRALPQAGRSSRPRPPPAPAR